MDSSVGANHLTPTNLRGWEGEQYGSRNMRSFAKSFYTSTAWQNCREAYKRSVGGLCERCLRSGLYSPGEIVHHKIHLTPDNIGDARITLDWNNLELLCRQCHAEEHEEEYKQRNKSQKRYKIDEFGRVVATE